LTKPPDSPPARKTKTAFSRRGFIKGASLAGGALSTGILETPAEAAKAAGNAVGPSAVSISLRINGKQVPVTVEPRTTLLDAMRNQLNLTGAKRVCDRGTCGACTVIVDGKAVYACTTLAIDAQGKNIETIEGFTSETKMHPVSAAFVNHDGQQCGYCTPGFVVAAKNFLDRHPNPTYEDVEKGLGGNLCRCGTYVGVRAAVLEAAKNMKGGSHA
jgi:aerobic-type carbon monoxide dehydrogenase small subunit (CoxS/CutS family)